jgi:hypothetical protein
MIDHTGIKLPRVIVHEKKLVWHDWQWILTVLFCQLRAHAAGGWRGSLRIRGLRPANVTAQLRLRYLTRTARISYPLESSLYVPRNTRLRLPIKQLLDESNIMARKFAALAAVLAVMALLFSGVTATSTCGRKCLLQILTVYTDAIELKNVSAIPIDPSVRITDNGNVTGLGDGMVWQTPGALRLPYRQALVDVNTGAATIFALITNVTVPVTSTAEEIDNPPPGQWWYYALRLKVVNSLITEVEELVSTIHIPGTDPASIPTEPDRIWDGIIPADEQMTSQDLQQVADDYWSTVGGTLPWPQAPFHPECQRVELGTQTTNAVFGPGSCGTEFLAPQLMGGTVTNRRFYVTDPARGIVAGIAWFGGQNTTAGTAILETFKIQDGLLRHIEAYYPLQGQSWSGWGTGKGCCPPS